MEFKKVLWPTDFSDNAKKALPYVSSLGEKYRQRSTSFTSSKR